MAITEHSLNHPIWDGEEIIFKAICDSSDATGLKVTYPVSEDGTLEDMTFTFRDAHGSELNGLSEIFTAGAYVKVIVDTTNQYAYILNADSNAYLEGRLDANLPKSGGTISGDLTVSGKMTANGMLILSSNVYGTELPTAGNAGRLFLLEVSE